MKEYKVGMYGGSFNPIHNGHIKCIKKALEKVDELHLIIGNLPNRDDFDIDTKLSWFREIFKDNKNVYLHILTDDSKEKKEYTLDLWIEDSIKIKNMIGKHIDVVFCGADYNREDNPYMECYKDSVIEYLDRGDNISSSRFKTDIDKYKKDVPLCVYNSYKEKFKS